MNVILGRCLGSQINVWTTFKERQKKIKIIMLVVAMYLLT